MPLSQEDADEVKEIIKGEIREFIVTVESQFARSKHLTGSEREQLKSVVDLLDISFQRWVRR